MRWSDGKVTGQELLAVTVSGCRIDFVVDLARVGVARGGTLYS